MKLHGKSTWHAWAKGSFHTVSTLSCYPTLKKCKEDRNRAGQGKQKNNNTLEKRHYQKANKTAMASKAF